MVIGADFGHNIIPYSAGADGRKYGGCLETDVNREVGKLLIKYLQQEGHIVINCTNDSASNQNEQLAGIVKKANAQKLDLFVSLHLNAFSDINANGTCTYAYSTTGKGFEYAKRVNNKLKPYWRDRGALTASFYVLRNTNAPAILIELFFCTNKSDYEQYQKQGADKIARLIAEGILNKTINNNANINNNVNNNTTNSSFLVKIDTDVLNVRNGASIDYKINTTVKKGEVFTIIETVGDWGRLKSGAGFINLKYTKKI